MKHYEKLKRAVKDGKFNELIKAETFRRGLEDTESDEVYDLECALMASVEIDGMIDERTKSLIARSAMEALAEKLVADKVFDFGKKIENFEDLFGVLKKIINL